MGGGYCGAAVMVLGFGNGSGSGSGSGGWAVRCCWTVGAEGWLHDLDGQ